MAQKSDCPDVDPQQMSEILAKAKDVHVLGIRGTGYEGDILDLLVDNELYFVSIFEITKPGQEIIQHLLPKNKEFEFVITGHVIVDGKTENEAKALILKAITSVSSNQKCTFDIQPTKTDNRFKIKLGGSIWIKSSSFKEADNTLLKAINAVCVDKSYDVYCLEKTTQKVTVIPGPEAGGDNG